MARRILAPLLLVAIALVVLPGSARAWWNADWPYRMRIVVGAGDGAATQVGRTTILVRLHQGVFNFNNAKEDGTDIRFVAGDDRTPLRFFVERYDSLADQVGLFWVALPDLATGGEGTPIYMYWGNRNAPPAASARETFDTETVLALNFADDAAAPRDSTGYGNNATSGARRDDGLIGSGQRFDGNAIVRIPESATLGWGVGGPVTWKLWARPDASGTNGVIYQARGPAGGITIGLEGGVPFAEIDHGGMVARAMGAIPIEAEQWRHLAVVASGNSLRLYLDARIQAEVAVTLPMLGGASAIGGPLPPADGAPLVPDMAGFVGVLDAVRIVKADRGPAFLDVAVRGEGGRSDLLRFDVPEEGSIFGTGHFGIIARNLTHDAWAVIGICAVLMPITWWIFGRKTIYISGSAGANRRFRRAYREALAKAGPRGIAAVEGLSDTAAHRRHRRSTLYQLWRTALEELETRGGLQRAGSLSEASLASIRAAIDREISAEGQKLMSGIVMLTIAISGGPFIGLLGTVIGVMITFAAVAAAGDVNVNAIAPGIAAALAATVAGLAVAIPALFGYNYLLVRIRDLNADMRVFADELVTRIGEGGTGGAPLAQRAAPLPLAAE